MSLVTVLDAIDPDRFPRVSGDEPNFVDGGVKSLEFSPRERG